MITRRLGQPKSRSRPSPGWPCGSLLLNVPHEDYRRDNDPVDILAIGGRDDELAGRYIGDFVGVRLDLDGVGEFFLRVAIGRLEPVADQLLDFRIVGPTEPGLAVIAAQRSDQRRRQIVRRGAPGVEDVPAALVDWLLGGAAGNEGAPVVGVELNIPPRLGRD